jgi:hypothetical protein
LLVPYEQLLLELSAQVSKVTETFMNDVTAILNDSLRTSPNDVRLKAAVSAAKGSSITQLVLYMHILIVFRVVNACYVVALKYAAQSSCAKEIW